MADSIDNSQDIIERFTNKTLVNILETKPAPYSGYCLHCEEPVTEARFCDRFCREDFEAQRKRNR